MSPSRAKRETTLMPTYRMLLEWQAHSDEEADEMARGICQRNGASLVAVMVEVPQTWRPLYQVDGEAPTPEVPHEAPWEVLS